MKSKTILGCIADDYTGATDLAGMLARSGVPVSLRMGIPSKDAKHADGTTIEIIALKCRNVPPKQASRQAIAALIWLQNLGATQFFWKYCSTFDSTAKGNIGPVAEALMAHLGTDQTIYCPAFPENGRSIYMGNLFVDDQPLAESPMKDHPLTPMRDSNLMRLLRPQVHAKVGVANHPIVARGAKALRDHLSTLRKHSVAHVVTDAITDADLSTIAEACLHMPLLTGGSAIAAALPDLYLRNGQLQSKDQSVPAPKVDGGRLVLSGSCADMTQKQVSEYLKIANGFQLDPIEIAKNGLDAARNWLANQDVTAAKIIYATAAPEAVRAAQSQLGEATASLLIEHALATLARDALTIGIRQFVVAGGESSGAVTRALGVNRMQIGGEIVPGVPWMFCTSDSMQIALALKSGNFGGKAFFAQAFEEINT